MKKCFAKRILGVFLASAMTFQSAVPVYAASAGESADIEMAADDYEVAYDVTMESSQDYYLKLDANGGRFTSDHAESRVYEWETSLYSGQIEIHVDREGYAFTGWYYDQDCTRLASTDHIYSVDYDSYEKGTTLYAGWSSDYWTVTLDATEDGYFVEGYENQYVLENGRYDWKEVQGNTSRFETVLIPKDAVNGLVWFMPYNWINETYVHNNDSEHKRFYGYVDENGSQVWPYSYYVGSDVLLTVKYSGIYSLTFDAGNGTFPEQSNPERADLSNVEYSSDRRTAVSKIGENDSLYSKNWYVDDGDNKVYKYIPRNPVPNDAGKTFLGWKALDGTLIIPGADHDGLSGTVTSDMSFDAVYSDACTVTFDLGGGSIGSENKILYSGIPAGTTLNDNSYEVPEDPKGAEGFIFDAWYTDSELTQRIDKKDILNYKINGDVTFYAGYSSSVKITFHANGGRFDSEDDADTIAVYVTKGAAAGSKAPIVNGINNRAFAGWYKDKECTDGPVNIYSFRIDEDVDLYAGYADDGYYTIRFRSGMNGVKFKDGNSEVVIRVKKGEPLVYSGKVNTSPVIDFNATARATNMAPTGFWLASDSSGNSGKYYFTFQGGLVHYDPCRIDDSKQYFLPDEGFVPTCDMTFTAEWKKQIIITLQADKNSVISSYYYVGFKNYLYHDNEKNQKDDQYFVKRDDSVPMVQFITHEGVKYGSIVSCLPGITSRKSDGYYVWGYKDTEGNRFDSADILDADTTIYTQKNEKGNPVLYGTVTFHAEDGKIYSLSNKLIGDTYVYKDVPFGVDYKYEYCHAVPDNSDYVFEGWYTDEALTKPYEHIISSEGKTYITYMADGITDLYAKFVPAAVISFDANGGYFDKSKGDYTQKPDQNVRSNTLVKVKTVPGYSVCVSDYSGRVRNDSNKVFAGWYLDKECTRIAKTKVYSNDEYLIVNDSVTLYAKWNDYYKPEKGIVAETSEINLDIGSKGKIKLSPANLSGVKYRVMDYKLGKSNTANTVPAVIDNEGYVLGQAEGTAIVRAEYKGFVSNEIKVTVSAKKVAKYISLWTDETTLRAGDKAQITALVAPEKYENMPFTWTSSNAKVATVSGTTMTATISAVGTGTTTITAKVDKLSAKITITVVDGIVVDKSDVQLTDTEGAEDTITVTVMGHRQDEAIVTPVLYDAEGCADAFVSIECVESTYNNGVGKYSYKVMPERVGKGQIVFTTGRGYQTSVELSVSARQRVSDVYFVGYNGDTVTNGQKISLYSNTRGASIRYRATYGSSIDALNSIAGDIDTEYIAPITVSTELTNGYVRIDAFACKAFLDDSEVVSKVFRIDNEGAWKDVDEADRDLFEDLTQVANSGLVVGHTPDSAVYSGDKVTFSANDLRVYYDGKLLTAGTDYNVAYANNVNAVELPDDLEDLTAAELKKLPKVTVTAAGNYQGVIERYFSIEKKSIAGARVTSNNVVTVLSSTKTIKPALVVMMDQPGGKAITLKAGTDYDVFYNKVFADGIVDYSNDYTQAEVLEEIRDGNIYDYLINFSGKGNYTGEYDTADNQNKAPRMVLITQDEIKAGYLQLDNAKLSKKPAKQPYTEKNDGTAMVMSGNIISMFEKGEIKVTVGNKALTYMPDSQSAGIKEDGYYYTIDDPADNDPEINRYVGSNNYVVIRPTSVPSSVSNKLVGEYKLFFDITGCSINVRYLISATSYSGDKLCVYSMDGSGKITGIDKEATMEKLFSNDKTAYKAGVSTTQVYIKSGKTEKVVSADCYDIAVTGDTGSSGTVNLVFSGIATKGTTGTVTRKIKVSPRKVTAKNVSVKFADDVDPSNVPYSKAGANPPVIVSNGDERLVENVDYTVSYSGNTKPGAAGKVNVKFKGNYSGSISNALSFTVGKAKFDSSSFTIESADKIYNAKAGKNYFKSVPVIYDNGKKLALKTDYVYDTEPVYTYAEDYVVRNANGDVIRYISSGTVIRDTEIVPAGAQIRVSFTARPAAKGSYKANIGADGKEIATSFEATYRIGAYNISSCTVKVQDQVYANDKVIIPSKDDFIFTAKKDQPVVRSDEFEIVSVTNNTRIGTATVVIRGNGNYCGTKSLQFKIVKGSIKNMK